MKTRPIRVRASVFVFHAHMHVSIEPFGRSVLLRVTQPRASPLTINGEENNIAPFSTVMRTLVLKTTDKGPISAVRTALDAPIHTKMCFSFPSRLSLAMVLRGGIICRTRCIERVCAASSRDGKDGIRVLPPAAKLLTALSPRALQKFIRYPVPYVVLAGLSTACALK